MGFGIAHDLVEGVVHDVPEVFVHFALAPEEALAVLHPFEIAHGDAAGVAKNIRDGEDALALDEVIGPRGGGPVGAFAENPGLHLMGVLVGDLVFDGRGDCDLAGLEEDIAGAHPGAAGGKVLQRLFLVVDPVHDLGDIEAVFVVEAAGDVREADDLVARLVHELGGHGADVAEALHDDAAARVAHAQLGEGFVAAHQHAAASGFLAAARAAQLDGLAGHDGGGGLVDVHGKGVHDPGHGLLVGAHIRRGHILLRAQPVGQLRGVAAGEALEFAFGHFAGVTDDAALGSAEGNVDDRALPGHPGGQGAHFVERNVGSEADAALARAAHRGVQNAVADEHFELAVVHPHGDVQGDLLAGMFQIAVEALLESEFLRGHFEARFRILVNVHFFRCRRLRHEEFSLPCQVRPGSQRRLAAGPTRSKVATTP